MLRLLEVCSDAKYERVGGEAFERRLEARGRADREGVVSEFLRPEPSAAIRASMRAEIACFAADFRAAARRPSRIASGVARTPSPSDETSCWTSLMSANERVVASSRTISAPKTARASARTSEASVLYAPKIRSL